MNVPLRVLLQVQGRDQAYLKLIIEAYEGMATLSCLDTRRGLLELTILPPFVADVTLLLGALTAEIQLERVCEEPGMPREEEKNY